jgi:hypothetical protein
LPIFFCLNLAHLLMSFLFVVIYFIDSYNFLSIKYYNL